MLVSVGEMRGYMGGMTFSESETRTMTEIISGVQQELETYLNRPVEPVQLRETVMVNGAGFAWLSITPVWKVIRYGFTGVELPEAGSPYLPPPMERDSLIGVDGRVVDKFGGVLDAPLQAGGVGLGYPNQRMTVEYIGGVNGYSTAAIKMGIKRVVAREWATNNVHTVGLRTGNPQETEVGDGRFLGWSSEELSNLDRFRRRVVVRG